MRNSCDEKRVAIVELNAMPRLGRIAGRWVGQGMRIHLHSALGGTHISLGVIAKNIVYLALAKIKRKRGIRKLNDTEEPRVTIR